MNLIKIFLIPSTFPGKKWNLTQPFSCKSLDICSHTYHILMWYIMARNKNWYLFQPVNWNYCRQLPHIAEIWIHSYNFILHSTNIVKSMSLSVYTKKMLYRGRDIKIWKWDRISRHDEVGPMKYLERSESFTPQQETE